MIKVACQECILKSILPDYIYHKNEKGKPCEMELPFLKNDITNNLWPQKPVVYCRSQQRTSQQSHRILIFSEAVGVSVGEANLDFFISCFGTDDEG